MSTYQDLKDKLVANAVELFTKHNVKQDVLFGLIRDAITLSVASKPKIRVLYNDKYGGFTLTDEFQCFVCGRIKCIRTEAPALMQAYGHDVLKSDKLSGLKDCLYVYETTNLHTVMPHVMKVHNNRKELANLVRNALALDNYLADPHASCDVKPTVLKPHVSYLVSDGSLEWFHEYARADLELVQTQVREGSYMRQLEADIFDNEQAVGEDLEDLLEHYAQVEKYNDYSHDRKTFIALLSEKGHKDDLSIWNVQHKYNTPIITYIIKRNLKPCDSLDSDMMNRVEENFGLVCASGKYTKLEIEEIPADMSWIIDEYDGKETVYVV